MFIGWGALISLSLVGKKPIYPYQATTIIIMQFLAKGWFVCFCVVTPKKFIEVWI